MRVKERWFIGVLLFLVLVYAMWQQKPVYAQQQKSTFLIPQYNWETEDVVLVKNFETSRYILDDDNGICYSLNPERGTAQIYDYAPVDEKGNLQETGSDRLIRIPDKLCVNNRTYLVDRIDIQSHSSDNLRRMFRVVFALGKYIENIYLGGLLYETSVVVHPENHYFVSDNGSLYSKNRSILYRFDGSSYGENGVFYLPDSVETLSDSAFLQACVKEVVLNDKIKKIPETCFFRSQITRINTKNVTNIEQSAFRHSHRLQFAYLPNVNEMGDFSFADCRRMDKVVFSTKKTCDFSSNSLFQDCWQLRTLILPENLQAVGSGFLKNCLALRILFLPSQVKKVEADSFCVAGQLTVYTMGQTALSYDDDNVSFCEENHHNMKRVAAYSCEDWNVECLYCETCGYGTECVSGTGESSQSKLNQPVDVCPKERMVNDKFKDESGLCYTINEGGLTATVSYVDYNRPFKKGFYTVPECIVKDGKKYVVDTIENFNFLDTEIPCYLVLPDTITTVEKGGINGPRIACIEFGKNVRDIGGFEIHGIDPRPIDTIYVPEDNPYFTVKDGVLFNKNMGTIYYCTASMPIQEYTIPKSVRKIREHALAYNELKQIIMYNRSKMEISSNALESCNAEIVDLADNTVNFADKTSLSDWSWYSSQDKMAELDSEYTDEEGMKYTLNGVEKTAVCSYIPDNLASDSVGIRIPDYVICEGRTYLVSGVSPVYGYVYKEYDKEKVFHIFIGKYVKEISLFAFFARAAIHVHEDNTGYVSEQGSLFTAEKDELIRFYDGGYNSDDVYQIPTIVGGIAETAFYGCDLKSVILNDRITSITSCCFLCSSIAYLDLNNVTGIEKYAFSKTSRLKEIEIPEAVTDNQKISLFWFGECEVEVVRWVGIDSVAVTDQNNSIRSVYGCKNLISAPATWFTGNEYGIVTPVPRITPTPTPTNAPTSKPSATATATATVSPNPTATATAADSVQTQSPSPVVKPTAVPANSPMPLPLIGKITIKQNKKNDIILSWKRMENIQEVWVYSSTRAKTGFHVIKVLKGSAVSYKDKNAVWGKRNYYKIKCIDKGGKYRVSGIYSVMVPKCSRPVIKVQKKRLGDIKYFMVQLTKYTGDYADIYLNTGKGFKKIKLFSHRIKRYKGKFKIQYTVKNKTLRIKVRTYYKKGKKKYNSKFSATKKIEV